MTLWRRLLKRFLGDRELEQQALDNGTRLHAQRMEVVDRLKITRETFEVPLHLWYQDVRWVLIVEPLLDRIEALEREHAKWRSSIPIRR